MSTAGAAVPESTRVTPSRPAGAGAVAGGLFALVAVTLVLQVLIGEPIPPVVVLDVLFIAVAVALLRGARPIVRWAAVVLPVLLVVANLPFAVPDLQHPESAAGFIPTLAIVVVALTTAGLALRHARGRSVPGRAVWSVAVGLLVLGAAGSLVAAAQLEDDVAMAGDATVTVVDFAYPEQLEVAAGEGVVVDNRDPFRHTFVVEGTDVAAELPASTARRVPVDLPPGEYRYLCDVPGHESMVGVLVVE